MVSGDSKQLSLKIRVLDLKNFTFFGPKFFYLQTFLIFLTSQRRRSLEEVPGGGQRMRSEEEEEVSAGRQWRRSEDEDED